MIHYQSGGTVISSESYNYDSANNLSSKTVDGTTTSYGYDNADQLTSESYTGYSASYTYDSNGNRLNKTLNGTTDSYSYDSADKLLSTSTKTYTYDAAGRPTKIVSGSNATTLAYDYENRVTSITLPGGTTNTFTYNGLDARTGKVDSTGTYSYRRDGVDVTDPVLNDSAAEYTPGISESRSGTSKFSHLDRLGTTTKITNASMATTDSRSFDAFGLLVGSTGSTPTPFGFAGGAGYQEDADTGLKMLGHRLYDPSTGRLLERDPLKAGRNWYSYCDNQPTKFVDPTGCISIEGIIEWALKQNPKQLPPGTLQLYKNNQAWARKVHLGLPKPPGGGGGGIRSNPDCYRDAVVEHIQEVLGFNPNVAPNGGPTSASAPQIGTGTDDGGGGTDWRLWAALGVLVVGTIALDVITGGAATPVTLEVVAGAAELGEAA